MEIINFKSYTQKFSEIERYLLKVLRTSWKVSETTPVSLANNQTYEYIMKLNFSDNFYTYYLVLSDTPTPFQIFLLRHHIYSLEFFHRNPMPLIRKSVQVYDIEISQTFLEIFP